MKVVFFSILSSTPVSLSRPISYKNNSSKTLFNLAKFATEKHAQLQLAVNLKYKRKNSFKIHKIHLKKSIIVRKINFLFFFNVKDLFTTGKNY